MFLLPPRLRQFFERRDDERDARVFQSDGPQVAKVKNARGDEGDYARVWDALSEREQEVTALTCLGYRSYEIAGTLGISYETVRTHSKHIYAKFGLGRKELRLALRSWDFREWLESRQG